jgi:hypothetical protein
VGGGADLNGLPPSADDRLLLDDENPFADVDLEAAAPSIPKNGGRAPSKELFILEMEQTAVKPPAPPKDAAYYGIAGELVRLIDPHTESDPVSVLVHFLVMTGNMIGRGPYAPVEADRHGRAVGGGKDLFLLGEEDVRADPGDQAEEVLFLEFVLSGHFELLILLFI